MNSKTERIQLEWKRIALGTGVSLVSMLALAAVTAGLVGNGMLDCAWMEEVSAVILLVTAFTGSMCAKGVTDRGIGALVAGAVYWFMMVMLNAVLFDASMQGAGAVALAIMGGSVISMFTGRGTGMRRNRRKYGYR